MLCWLFPGDSRCFVGCFPEIHNVLLVVSRRFTMFCWITTSFLKESHVVCVPRRHFLYEKYIICFLKIRPSAMIP
jgi:hypothetical protein